MKREGFEASGKLSGGQFSAENDRQPGTLRKPSLLQI